ncbi:hypothetical protein I7I53_03053 [Histoplasma capsulatum var. duboisii H88]|uniref:Uncharacterized protein n=1 Tax=Ajellomyces capsulatus (strain H88) TaxID=544711 RepID=A0A8A1LQ33_AJEC8|nr:hypothetical protein I7I53_03053 [Histoplasma capsulatum var. duboisii H88]
MICSLQHSSVFTENHSYNSSRNLTNPGSDPQCPFTVDADRTWPNSGASSFPAIVQVIDMVFLICLNKSA